MDINKFLSAFILVLLVLLNYWIYEIGQKPPTIATKSYTEKNKNVGKVQRKTDQETTELQQTEQQLKEQTNLKNNDHQQEHGHGHGHDHTHAVSNKQTLPPNPLKEGQLKQLFEEYHLVDIQNIDPSIQVDLKYATQQNFMGQNVYGDLKKAYLRHEIAQKLSKAQEYLKEHDPHLSLLVLDAARPVRVQQYMWDLVKNTPQRHYVAYPGSSIHNYGAAVDLTIVNKQGEALDMGTPYDHFGPKAGSKKEAEMLQSGELQQKHINNRNLLRSVMRKAGFLSIRNEWWHFEAVRKKEVAQLYRLIK